MPIFNQNLDASEKKTQKVGVVGAFATGVTNLIYLAPYNCLLKGFNLGSFGLSNTPTYSLSLFRTTSGGLTSIALGISLTGQEFGTSGPVGASITGPGYTLIAGDAVVLTSGGSNASTTTSVYSVTVQCLADFKSYQNCLA